MANNEKKHWFEQFEKLPELKLPRLRLDNIGHVAELEIGNAGLNPEKIKIHTPAPGEHYPAFSFETVKEVFLHSMENYSDRLCLLCKDSPRDKVFKEYTYRDFGNDVEALGTALLRIYSRENGRIVIIGENQYDWYVSYMAALTGAGIAVPVDKELPENELQQVINRARASVVIYTPSMHIGDRLRSIMDELPTVKAFIEMKSDAPRTGRFVGIKTVIAEGRSALLAGDNTYRSAETPADDFRALFFTSGTTASSKGVMASSRQLAANINAVSAYVKLYPSDRLFSVLPLHHTYESSIGFLVPFANGASIAVNSGLKHIAEELRDSHPTIIISVPLLLESLYSNIMKSIRRSGKEDIVNAMMSITNGLKSLGIDVKRKVFKEIHEGLGGNLRLIVSAAAPIDRKIGKWFSDLGVNFLQGYGLTETSPIAAVTPEYDPRVGSAGKTIAGGIIKVKNPDASGSGELMISTDTLMMGYYEDPEATAEAIETDENGRRWFNSGDLGYIDNDDFVYITGRIKNVIVTQNGKNIYPEELELLLADIPEIRECMVYGKEVDGSKELVVTCRAIPDDDRIKAMHGNVSDKEVYDIIFAKIKEVNRKVTNYKAIKRLELKDGEFIKTSTKKIKRFAEIREGKILDIGK